MLRQKRTFVVAAVATLAIVFALPTHSVWAESQPGRRPDRRPSILSRLLLGTSLESEIVKQSSAVERSREKFVNIPADKEEGFLFFKHKPKNRALQELKKQKNALKNLLASTPPGANVAKPDVVGGNPENANAEAMEVKFALENLRNVVMQGRKELMADPTNLQKATKYYDAHVVCLATIVEMHDEFVENIDNKYVPATDKLISRLEALWKQTKEALSRGFKSEQARQKVQQIKNNQEVLLKAIIEVRTVRLPELKDWAIANRPPLVERLSVARLAKDTLDVTKEARALIRDFGSDYEKLRFSPPPLIVFEVDLSDYELP
jgi:hypothetical protein